MNGPAGQGEGRCSGGEMHHSASRSVLRNEIHMSRSFIYTLSKGLQQTWKASLRLTSSHLVWTRHHINHECDAKGGSTWWEGPGWDRGHDNPSSRSWHVGHLLPVLSIQTPAAGSVRKHWRGKHMDTSTQAVLHLTCIITVLFNVFASHLSPVGSCEDRHTAYRG